MTITHEAMVELIVETLQAEDGAGSDMRTGDRFGEWLEVYGNLDVHHLASDVLEATKPRQITTQEELDALPICTAIRDGDPEVCVKVEPTGWLAEIDGEVYRSDQITLPATVLWEPTA